MSQETLRGGQLASAISTAIVHRLAETTGRGPTKARTTIGQDAIFVVVQDTLTKGERVLIQQGDGALVLSMRRRWQEAMRDAATGDIERLTGREVIGFMSDNQIDPDLAVEAFVLAPEPMRERVAEGESLVRA
jgi:uncharacterized protein YbcI